MGQALYSAKVEDIAAMVKGISWPADTLMILERLPLRWLNQADIDTGLCFERFEADTAFNTYERGRIFHQDGELRWEKIEQRFWAVYVGSDDITLPEAFSKDDSLSLDEPRSQTYYLWGKRLNQEALAILGQQQEAAVFAEFTVGGILTPYPVEAPPPGQQDQLALSVAEYIEPGTKELQYYRFQGVNWQ